MGRDRGVLYRDVTGLALREEDDVSGPGQGCTVQGRHRTGAQRGGRREWAGTGVYCTGTSPAWRSERTA